MPPSNPRDVVQEPADTEGVPELNPRAVFHDDDTEVRDVAILVFHDGEGEATPDDLDFPNNGDCEELSSLTPVAVFQESDVSEEGTAADAVFHDSEEGAGGDALSLVFQGPDSGTSAHFDVQDADEDAEKRVDAARRVLGKDMVSLASAGIGGM